MKDVSVVKIRSIINSDCYIFILKWDYMNKADIVELLKKRGTQLMVSTVVFVGMMVFLTPSLIEVVDGYTDATAAAIGTGFSNWAWHMEEGIMLEQPHAASDGTLKWVTKGNGAFGGNEKGIVEVTVENFGQVVFSFSNPDSGPNTCDVTHGKNLRADCSITSSSVAKATYMVTPATLSSSNNNYCEILSKFGGFEQTEVIRDKLNC